MYRNEARWKKKTRFEQYLYINLHFFFKKYIHCYTGFEKSYTSYGCIAGEIIPHDGIKSNPIRKPNRFHYPKTIILWQWRDQNSFELEGGGGKRKSTFELQTIRPKILMIIGTIFRALSRRDMILKTFWRIAFEMYEWITCFSFETVRKVHR